MNESEIKKALAIRVSRKENIYGIVIYSFKGQYCLIL
jgi:hypothetical protein